MARRSTKTNPIHPVALTVAALKAVRSCSDYNRLSSTTEPAVLEAAWTQLPKSEQQRITDIVNSNTAPTPEAIAQELSACGTHLQLKAIKAEHGEVLVRSAWSLLPQSERDRIKALCTEPQPEPEPQPEGNGAYTQDLTKQSSAQQQLHNQPGPKKTLVDLTAELQQLDALLDMVDGDISVELQQVVDSLLAQRVETQDQLLEKLDNYCGLIQSRLMWAATRKAEADRLAKLAETDIKTVEFLKARLKAHLEASEQKKLRTKRFNISVSVNSGKPPIRFDSTPPEQMPERFVRVTVEPDKEAIRTALEAGKDLKFAYLAQRETHLRIK